jgi:hypothetical protein
MCCHSHSEALNEKLVFYNMKLLSIFVLVTSFVALAEEKTPQPSYILCKNGPIVRTMRVQLNGRACKAFYTKEGVDQLVGRSGTPDLCFTVIDKIRINLEVNHWKCKDISQARVSSRLE